MALSKPRKEKKPMETYEIISSIVAIVFIGLSLTFGIQKKDLLSRVRSAGFLLREIEKALEDGILSPEEISNIVKKAKAVIS